MNNRIKNSRDKIQPSEEARARMLESILAQNKTKKFVGWKAIAPVAACLIIAAVVFAAFTSDNNGNTPAGPAIFLAQSTNGVNASITREYFDYSTSFNVLASMTEDELINKYSDAIFEGTILDMYNLKVTMAEEDEMYYGYAVIKVDDVIHGDLLMNESGEVKVMLPGPVMGGESVDKISWVEDTDITSQFAAGQKGIFIVTAMNDEYDYREVYGEKFFYRDLADYRFADGTRCAFIDTNDSVLFDRSAYPTISNAVYLSEVKEFIIWKLGLGDKSQPLDGNRFQLKQNDNYENLPISYAQALDAAAKENGIKADENGKILHRGVNPYLWTYGEVEFSEAALAANPALAKTGQPKDLPVYIVDFAAASEGADKNLYVIVDATTGYVLMSYNSTSVYIR